MPQHTPRVHRAILRPAPRSLEERYRKGGERASCSALFEVVESAERSRRQYLVARATKETSEGDRATHQRATSQPSSLKTCRI